VAASTVFWHPFFMVKIFGFEKSQSGCDWYRIKQPLIQIRAHKAAEVRLFHKGQDFDWFASDEAANKLNEYLTWADVLFVPRLSEPKMVAVLKEFQKLGKKIVSEWDDNFMCVNPLTHQYGYFGTEEYSEVLNGETIEVWKDGKNIDLQTNRENMKLLKEGLEMSDMVLTTGEDIANAFRPINSNIRICPNSVDVNFWEKLPLQTHSGIRMGWMGGDTHYHDWLMIAPILKPFMDAHPQVTLVIMGGKYEGTLKGIDPRRIEHHPFCDINAYPYKAAILDLDFSLIPLVDTEFNRCKSSIKWLEMAALHVPSVTSYVRPYAQLMDLVKDNGIFVEGNSLDGWYEGLDILTKDSLFRKRMGTAARETVCRFYDANKTWKIWLDSFEEVNSWPNPRVPQLSVL
jgi:glycosyltransferase involved in cell wall biosynthesis